ncbi:Uncharacterised protein [Vibrio cholerae]|nr:Uncharacterised protein [Vibrio cholerae]
MINAPLSFLSRISRPTPCFKVITASGSCTCANGSPPRKRQSSMRALSNGSSGAVNGNLSMITQLKVSPRTSIPSQKAPVATNRALPSSINSANVFCLLVSPCINTGKVKRSRKRSPRSRIMLCEVHKKKQRPWLCSITGASMRTSFSARPGLFGSGK